MNAALIIFLVLCVLCATLLLFALVFGARQERYRAAMREDEENKATNHTEH